MNRLSRLDVLLADEMGYLCLNKDQSNLFFKLMDNRYLAKKSTIITTNLGFDDWGNFFSDPAMTAALLSRLKHRCIVIQIDGPDLRDPNLGISGALASRSPSAPGAQQSRITSGIARKVAGGFSCPQDFNRRHAISPGS